jgi:hypothetical protein
MRKENIMYVSNLCLLPDPACQWQLMELFPYSIYASVQYIHTVTRDKNLRLIPVKPLMVFLDFSNGIITNTKCKEIMIHHFISF